MAGRGRGRRRTEVHPAQLQLFDGDDTRAGHAPAPAVVHPFDEIEDFVCSCPACSQGLGRDDTRQTHDEMRAAGYLVAGSVFGRGAE
jgi:hypothetical protein